MCGGYTRVCVQCGMCGKVEQRPMAARGVCVLCGKVNDPSQARCSACGAPLPKAPGDSADFGATSGAECRSTGGTPR